MTEKPTIVEALAAVMAEVKAVGKDDRNNQQGYNFRGVDAVVNACGPVLRKHCVIVVPMLESSTWRDVKTSTGKDSREVTVQVRYRFHGPDGSYLDAIVPGESMDFGDKGAPKAMSVAYRIALLQALCIPTDEPEADSYGYERAAPVAQPEPQWEQPLPEAKTDWDWANKFETRVAEATTQGHLKGLFGELHVKHQRRELTDEDRTTLVQLVTMRKTELEKSPA
jgi:hypothetical protein